MRSKTREVRPSRQTYLIMDDHDEEDDEEYCDLSNEDDDHDDHDYNELI